VFSSVGIFSYGILFSNTYNLCSSHIETEIMFFKTTQKTRGKTILESREDHLISTNEFFTLTSPSADKIEGKQFTIDFQNRSFFY
jgi:hypothetical protein